MDDRDAPSWLALLAPLPEAAVPTRGPVAPDTLTSTPEGQAIAGWEHLVISLSAGAAGLRTVLVVLDETGRPISASDSTVYRKEDESDHSIEWRHENLGGRIEPDGTFLGTRWRSANVEAADGTIRSQEQTPSEPTQEEIEGIAALVAEVLRRAPGPAGG